MQEKQKFDFNGAISNFSEIESKKKALKNSQRNKNLALAGVAVAAISGITYGINSSIENSRAEIDATIATAKTNNTPLDKSISWLEAQEAKMRSQKNTTEQLMNSAFAQKRNTIQLLGAEREVATLYKKLNDAHIKDAKDIQALIVDMKSVKKVIDNQNSDYDQKEDVIASNSFKNWAKVSDMQKKDAFVASNLAAVTNEYEGFVNEIVTFEKQYVQVIKEVIASGKYSLNQTQAEVMSSIQSESNSVRGEFEEVQNEISESVIALVSEGQEVGSLASEFTMQDLAEAKSAIGDMENAALQKAMEDKRTVEAMINSINNGQSVESALGMTGEVPTATAAVPATTTTTTTTSSSGGGSMMPFLMGMWLGNAFSSSPSYNNYSSANTNNTRDKDRAGSYAGGGGSAAASSSNSSRFNQAVASTKPTASYSFRNQDSYLNKSATNSSRAMGSTSLKSAQTKLNNSKIAANRATSLKQAAFSKAGIAPNTRASQARMAISQQRATSVSSRGGYSGARGMSSGG